MNVLTSPSDNQPERSLKALDEQHFVALRDQRHTGLARPRGPVGPHPRPGLSGWGVERYRPRRAARGRAAGAIRAHPAAARGRRRPVRNPGAVGTAPAHARSEAGRRANLAPGSEPSGAPQPGRPGRRARPSAPGVRRDQVTAAVGAARPDRLPAGPALLGGSVPQPHGAAVAHPARGGRGPRSSAGSVARSLRSAPSRTEDKTSGRQRYRLFGGKGGRLASATRSSRSLRMRAVAPQTVSPSNSKKAITRSSPSGQVHSSLW